MTRIGGFAARVALVLLGGCSGIDGLPDEPRKRDGVADATAALIDADVVTVVDAGPTDESTLIPDAGSDATVDAAPCLPEGDLAFCARLGKNCGTVVASDNCGVPRTVASCGVCTSYYESCGGAWVDNVCGCTPESDWSFCTRLGRTCGALAGTDNCGLPRAVGACGGACSVDAGPPDAGISDASTGAVTAETMATTARLTGPGLSDCGPNGNDVCARSLFVPGGTFFRGETTNYPATISDFRLDKYEVSVGRFRKFVEAWVSGWRPTPGSGKHSHLNGGAGLVNTAGGNEPGWDAAWTAYVGAPGAASVIPTSTGATTKANWDTTLNCGGSNTTWTSAAEANEKRPQNCLTWFDLYAFCIWDGGFLPSEAEWEYAAAGGSEERTYPWGATAPAANAALAIYGCYLNGSGPGSCSGVTNIAPVGTVAAGAGRWGQLDLAGNIWEWASDSYVDLLSNPCSDCSVATSVPYRAYRGGYFGHDITRSAERGAFAFAANRYVASGGRCARPPSGGTCTGETDAAFCTRLGATCGSKSGTDNCGQARTVANCGACGSSATCGLDNRCRAAELTCSAGTLPGGGYCQACALNTCSLPTCDDGTSVAPNLGAGALDCHYRFSPSNWVAAMTYCTSLGNGWRLPTKGEALKLAASPNVCRTPLSAGWYTWTTTCSGAGMAWNVYGFGNLGAYQDSVDGNNYAVCVR